MQKVQPGPPVSQWKSLLFVQEKRALIRLTFLLQPRLGLYLPPLSLLLLGCGSGRRALPPPGAKLPSVGYRHGCVIPAASLTHKEVLRRRGGRRVSVDLHGPSEQTDEASVLPQYEALTLLWYSGSGSGRQILYCYVMNIFPSRLS